MKRRKECIVIGAGLAGLAAAYRLKHHQFRVTVLEARDRLGGRVLTHRFLEAPELNCELGGEWIGKNHTEMRSLCHSLGLDLQPHQYANSFSNGVTPAQLIPPGEWCLSAEAKEKWNRFAEEFKDYGKQQWKEMDKIDWWTQLSILGFSREDLLRRDLMEKVDTSDEMDFKVIGGYTKLVEALADKIGRENIRLSTKS